MAKLIDQHLDKLIDLWFKTEPPNREEDAQVEFRIRMSAVVNSLTSHFREEFLNLVDEGEVEDEYDGDVDDYGRSIGYYTFRFHTTSDNAIRDFLKVLDIPIEYDQGPADAINKELQEAIVDEREGTLNAS